MCDLVVLREGIVIFSRNLEHDLILLCPSFSDHDSIEKGKAETYDSHRTKHSENSLTLCTLHEFVVILLLVALSEASLEVELF